jgi:hypothetical protein
MAPAPYGRAIAIRNDSNLLFDAFDRSIINRSRRAA